MAQLPAAMGGSPMFRDTLGVVKPALPKLDNVVASLRIVWKSGRVSNNSPFVREFETLLKEVLAVRHAIAMCNGTLTLVLALKALGIQGRVVVPSFTFCATVHAIVWAGLRPVFADIDPDTFNITPQTVEAVMTEDVRAVMPVHVFGSPCDISGFESLARRHNLGLVFDSAQAMGSRYWGRQLGSSGDAESFSLHATKILPTGEGGVVTTNDDGLATYLRSARSFGIIGDVDCDMVGINAKMAEFPAILGLEGLNHLQAAIDSRSKAVELYTRNLRSAPGLRFQSHLPEAQTNHQNFAILVDEKEFGLDRDALWLALKAENIMTRKYFYPPMHSTSAYRSRFMLAEEDLPVTRRVSESVLCLPLYSGIPAETVDKVCAAISNIHAHAPRIRSILAKPVSTVA